MSVYAPVPAFAERSRRPRTLLLIVAAHAALLAAAMSAKMDLTPPWDPTRTEVKLVPLPPEPVQNPPQPIREPRKSVLDQVPSIVPVPQPGLSPVYTLPPLPEPGPAIGAGQPSLEPAPQPAPIRTGPRFITPESLIKPPYPPQKLRLDEEAVLRLRLSIDERGRVTAVEPLGRADLVFLAAARRHLLANWRYQPATEDGRPVPTATVISLRFQLEN